MNGLTILQRLRENPNTQQIPIIILTAKAQPHEEQYFHQLKVASFITKPYNPLTISEHIAAALS